MQIWGWDTETHLIAESVPHPRPVCHALVSDVRVLTPDPTFLLELLRHDAIVVAHNAAFDVLVTCVHHPDAMPEIMQAVADGRILCSMLAELLRQGERDSFAPASLAACTARHLGVSVDKGDDTWRLRYADLDGIPIEQWPSEARRYALDDAYYARELFLHLGPRVQSMRDLPSQTRGAVALEWMRQWGMPIDKVAVGDLALRTLVAQQTALQECRRGGLIRKDGSVDTSLLEREVVEACAACGIEPQRTPTGKIKRDKGALEALPELTPLLQSHREYAHESKILGAYVTPLASALPAGRVRPSVRSLVATGRTSMSSPPMQQIPRKGGVRECIVASPGHDLAIADYDGAEFRALGQAMLDAGLHSPMAELFQRDPTADAHLDFAASMMGITYAEAARRLADGDIVVTEARQRAKAGNFGFPGGMGGPTFVKDQAAQGATFTLAEAKRLREQYMDQWKVRAFFKWVQRSLDTDGAVTLRASGRKRKGRFPQCANYCFQGLTADVAKRACWLVVWECVLGSLQGCRLVHFVHDELIVEAPKKLTAHACSVVQSSMLAAGREYMPDVPMRVTPRVSSHWTK